MDLPDKLQLFIEELEMLGRREICHEAAYNLRAQLNECILAAVTDRLVVHHLMLLIKGDGVRVEP